MKLLCIIGVLCFLACDVNGHGYLLEPPGRASAWRAGFPTPHNYDDNALFCGGFARQQGNGGKCGICGDPWDAPVRENEAGGRFATGIIVRNYTVGDVINFRVDVTANHFGWMEFRLCPNNNVHKAATQECLDKHVLAMADGSGTRYKVSTRKTGYYDMKMKLPDGLTCTQCVLQWKYHAGNSWGVDPVTRRGCVGCGPQEEFYGCADIGIQPRGNGAGVVTPGPQPIPTTTKPPVTTRRTIRTDRPTPKPTPRPTPNPTPKPTQQPVVIPQSGCRAINNWAGVSGMDAWCTRQCAKGNCPEYGCACGPLAKPSTSSPSTSTTTTTTTTTPTTTTTTPTTTTTTPTTTTTTKAPPTTQKLAPLSLIQCKAINFWAGDAYLDKWCADSCARGNCPVTSCKCTAATQPTTPPTTPPPTTTTPTAVLTQKVCQAISVWKGIDVFDRWCTETCNKGTCPSNTCYCVDTPLLPMNIKTQQQTTPTTTTTTLKPAAHAQCNSNGRTVAGTYWDSWCQKQCNRDYCPVEYCDCRK